MKSLIVLLVLFAVAGAGRLLDSNLLFYSAPVVAALVSLRFFLAPKPREDEESGG